MQGRGNDDSGNVVDWNHVNSVVDVWIHAQLNTTLQHSQKEIVSVGGPGACLTSDVTRSDDSTLQPTLTGSSDDVLSRPFALAVTGAQTAEVEETKEKYLALPSAAKFNTLTVPTTLASRSLATTSTTRLLVGFNRRTVGLNTFDFLGKGSDGWELENSTQWQIDNQLLSQLKDHSGGQHRVTTQVEEGVFWSNGRRTLRQDTDPQITDLGFAFGGGDKFLEPFDVVSWNNVRDQSRFVVVVLANQSDILTNKRMLGNVGVDFTQFDSETSNLDLIIGPTTTLGVPVRQITTQVTGSVQSVSWTLPELSPWFTLTTVPFRQTSSTDIDLTNFTNTTSLGSVVSVDNQQLDVLHTFTSRHDILLRFQEGRVMRSGGNFEIRNCSLRFSGTVHVNDEHVLGQSLQSETVSLGQDITDKESMMQVLDLSSGLSREQLTHSWSQMGDCGTVSGEPFSQFTRSTNVIGSWDQQLGTEENRSEHISLNWIMCNTGKHGELIGRRQLESLSHPVKVVS
ncbi:hypothetical protein WICPIJ_006211 [Wickerhamomyces pijperi]|uniref:Uncharacterized protein n=1 Tax=Wickerhamomyces pijperi TaxID=599730 RepID=A0A9P8TKE5_WICPI|nr:hypothetical protein WICPIJ_006211 [Wickerhamomyces pijperi]